MPEGLEVEIKTLAENILKQEGVDLVELKIGSGGQKVLIRITADLPSGGITLQKCSEINKKISRTIEEVGLIESDYLVEVNSPGTDWPMTTPKDFARVLGRPVRIFLKEAFEKKLEYEGVLEGVKAEAVLIASATGGKEIPFVLIHKAVQNL
jgi:ribosome maturation factor RimP